MRDSFFIVGAMAVLGCQQILGIQEGKTASGGNGGDGAAGGAATTAQGGTSNVGGAGGTGGGGGGGEGGVAVQCDVDIADHHVFPSPAIERVTAMGVASDGSGIVAGWFIYGALDFPPPHALDEPPTSIPDCFIAQLEASGAFAWSRRTTGDGDCNIRDLHVDTDGNIYLVGTFGISFAFEGQPPVTVVGTGAAGFILKLDSGGNFLGQQFLHGVDASNITPTSIEETGNGGIWVGGQFDGQLSFDGFTPYVDATHGAEDAFLIALDKNTLMANQGYVIGSSGPDTLGGLAYVSPGVVAATGSFDGTWDLGGPDLTSTSVDAWLGVIDASVGVPTLSWVHGYGEANADVGVDVVSRNGTLHAVGTIANNAVVEGTLVDAGSTYLLSIGADQTSPTVTAATSEGGPIMPTSVAVTDDDHIVVAGWTEGTDFTVDTQTLAGGAGARHGFVFALDAEHAWVFSALVGTDTQAQPDGDSTFHDVASRGCRTWVGGTMGTGIRSLYTATSAPTNVTTSNTEDIFLLGLGN